MDFGNDPTPDDPGMGGNPNAGDGGMDIGGEPGGDPGGGGGGMDIGTTPDDGNDDGGNDNGDPYVPPGGGVTDPDPDPASGGGSVRDVVRAGDEEEEEDRKRGRSKGTILTSAQGIVGGAPIRRKTLLGL